MRRSAVAFLTFALLACEPLQLPPDGGVDAGPDGCAEPLECIGAPLGCHYRGGDRCTWCGEIVCEDGGRDAGHADAAGDAEGGSAGDADTDMDGAADDAGRDADDGAADAAPAGLACGAKAFPSF